MQENQSQSRIVPNIYQRILGVMQDVEYIAKGSAKVNGQYRFVSHDAVVGKLHGALVKHGIAVIPTVETMTQVGNRTEAKLAVVFRNADNPQDSFYIHSYGYGIDGGDKGPGKAVSYAFKYALLKVFCLETGDDPDNDANALHEPEKCLEFDSMLPETFAEKDLSRMNKFLQASSELMNKHVEDVKREAITKMPEFLAAFRSWSVNKKEAV